MDPRRYPGLLRRYPQLRAHPAKPVLRELAGNADFLLDLGQALCSEDGDREGC